METTILDLLHTGCPTPWQVVGKCVNKRRHNLNSRCPFLCFDLSDHTATIEVVSFNELSFEIDKFVQVGEHYRVQSAHAQIKRANPDFSSNPYDIVIKSLNAIRRANDPSPALATSDFGALPLASPPHDPSAFLSVPAIRDIPDQARCCFRGRVHHVQAARISALCRSRDVTLCGADDSDTICVRLHSDLVEKVQDDDHNRGARMEIKAARVYRSAVTNRVTLEADKESKVNVTFDRSNVSPPTIPSLSTPPRILQTTTLINASSNPSSECGDDIPSTLSVPSQPLCNRKSYVAFISHAGPDKENFAIPLYEQLRNRNMSSFIDREEMLPGERVSDELLSALNHSRVGIFILSPEFVARKWPMRELHRFLERQREARKNGRQEPTIIPVFHRWGPNDWEGDFYDICGINGEEVFNSSGFFEPERQHEMSTEEVRQCLKEAKKLVGVSSDERGKAGDTDAISRVIIKVEEAISEHMKKDFCRRQCSCEW